MKKTYRLWRFPLRSFHDFSLLLALCLSVCASLACVLYILRPEDDLFKHRNHLLYLSLGVTAVGYFLALLAFAPIKRRFRAESLDEIRSIVCSSGFERVLDSDEEIYRQPERKLMKFDSLQIRISDQRLEQAAVEFPAYLLAFLSKK